MSAGLLLDPAPTLAMVAILAAATVAGGAGALATLRACENVSRRVWSERRALGRAPNLPRWLRICMPLAAPLADSIGPRLPVPLRQGLHRWLQRAELGDELQAQHWLAVASLWACAGLAVLVAAPLGLAPSVLLALTLGVLPWAWLRDTMRRRQWEVLRDLPSYADMLTLALEAGGALSVALQVATARAPDGVLRRAFLRLQGELRAGRSRVDALRSLGERLDAPGVAPFVAALIQAEANGASLAGALRAQSQQRLDERFARAEKLAMEAPVKMLLPLVLCIFPCTFVVLGFPVFLRIVAAGFGP